MWRCPTYLHLKRWGFVCLISISKIEKENFPGGKVDTVSNCYFFLSYNLQDLGYIKKGAWFKSILFKSSYHPHNLDLIPGATGRLKAPPPRPPAQRSREFLPSEREVPSLPCKAERELKSKRWAWTIGSLNWCLTLNKKQTRYLMFGAWFGTEVKSIFKDLYPFSFSLQSLKLTYIFSWKFKLQSCVCAAVSSPA